jgi:RNA polymerase sigma-70 factor (ECF subfamily)
MAAVSAAAERLEHLAATVGPDVLAYLARRVSPVEDAADVYSQVLTITWQKLRVVPTEDREAFAWMLGVARRCLANHRRGLLRRSALADRLRDEVRTAVTEPDDAAGVDAQRALASLSDADQELVTLVYWEGLTCAEAAGVLGVSGAAARKRLERARAALRSWAEVGERRGGHLARS